MRSPAQRSAAPRVAALRAVFLLLFLALAARAAHLSVAYHRGDGVRQGQIETTLTLAASRGRIVDRNGLELALSIHAPSAYAIPSALEDLDAAARALGSALGHAPERVRERLAGREGFTYLARWMDEERAERIRALDLDAVGIVREPRRAYPFGSLAARVIGFSNIDGTGVRGIEQQENGWLKGQPRSVAVERDGARRLLAVSGVELLDANGGDVALALDARMQADAEKALAAAIEDTGAVGGTVVTLDPHTGALRAIAEWPSFDPNQFRTAKFSATRSQAFLDAVEPGSVMKIFLVAAGLETGAIGADEDLDCSSGALRVRGKTIRDRRDFGVLDPRGVLQVSSNVGAVRIAQKLGAPDHHAALLRFGFGRRTGTGFPSESAGLLRPHERWQPVDQATVAFGQGISVTAIQLVAATAAIANGGEWHQPRLVEARRGARGSWERLPTAPPRRVLRPEVAAQVLEMMESVVHSEGTGRLAGLEGVRVAGKTGTAQKIDPETGRYSQNLYRAWFVGVAPADDPRLVIAVSLDEPQGARHSGGAVAAPLFAQVAASQLGSLGIRTRARPLPPAPPRTAVPVETRVAVQLPPEPPDSVRKIKSIPNRRNPSPTAGVETSIGTRAAAAVVTAKPPPVAAAPAHPPALPVSHRSRNVSAGHRVLLPDFRGLSMPDVMRITSENALDLQVRGRGQAVEQNPHPGTIVSGTDRRVWVRFVHLDPGEG